MYGGGRAMWYPGRGSFLLGSAVVGDGGRGRPRVPITPTRAYTEVNTQ